MNGALFTYEKDHAAELEEYRSAGGAEEAANGAPLKNAVVFMGKMNYQPNVDAALWYLKNVHPKVCDRVPFVIVGAYPTEEVRKAAAGLKNVTVTGFVKDPYLYVSAAMAAAAPMQSGGGIQNKVLEGMALGKVNLVSKLAADALEGLDGERELILADRPEDYIRILRDMKKAMKDRKRPVPLKENTADPETGKQPGKRLYDYDAIGKAAKEYIRARYTW